MKINKFSIGDKACIKQKITNKLIQEFSRISQDNNPIHIDSKYAESTIFKKIAHGMLVASYISAVLGTKIPGPGAIYLSQSLSFLKPVFINDTINAEAEITHIKKDKNIITLKTKCYNQNKEDVIIGEAVLKVI